MIRSFIFTVFISYSSYCYNICKNNYICFLFCISKRIYIVPENVYKIYHAII